MPGKREAIDDLMAASERVLGLQLTFHANDGIGLASRWRLHRSAPCMGMKAQHRRRCMAFDGGDVHVAMRVETTGRVHTCPFGMTELAVPLLRENRVVGVLFAGQVWRGRGKPPHPALARSPGEAWLRDRLVLLRGVARELTALLTAETVGPDDRGRLIAAYLRGRLDRDLSLADLARHLSLSVSRTRRVVREQYGAPFTQVLREARLTEAARLLRVTDWPVGQVAAAVGWADPAYFSRQFSRHFGLPPRDWRRRAGELA